ncbi:helix-turn-helix domain-containing protein [Sorangium sp. So ce693]|uniref:helix-turn-helix domain-containing protein n=1 Tax=Sorangium sp. So ce693 TaxID=3133318 RepID=UPI003F6450EB
MAKACVDDGDETRVLLWATGRDPVSFDRLSPQGARSLAEHLVAVSTERALLERQVLLLLQQHATICEVEQLDAARSWMHLIAAGEVPEQTLGVHEATLRGVPLAVWKERYGDDSDGRVSYERRRTEATLRLASALLIARTSKRLNDVEIASILTDATASWVGASLSAPAAQRAADADAAAVRDALAAASGNVERAAEALSVNRRTLDRRINALGLRTWLTETYSRSARQPRRGA